MYSCGICKSFVYWSIGPPSACWHRMGPAGKNKHVPRMSQNVKQDSRNVTNHRYNPLVFIFTSCSVMLPSSFTASAIALVEPDAAI